jgi:phospholipid/cholesterol/gamma-HCH transport system substrate-binding protein
MMKSMVLGTMVDPGVRQPGILLRRAVAAVVIAIVLSSLVLAYGKGMFFDRVQVSAVVDDAGGALTPGSDVKSKGVIIGEVTSITTDGDRVRIGLDLTGRHARALPHDVKARVLPATVFGTTFVDLVAPDADTSATGLQANQVIQQDTSVETVELQDTLDSTDRVLSAINPAELSTTLSRVAGAMKGRGSELGGTLETLDGYLARLEPHLPLLQEDLRLLGINLHVLAETSPDLLKALDDSLTTTRTITDKRRQFATSLTQAHGLVDTADAFVRDQRKQIIATLANSAVTFDALYDHRKGLAGGFQSFVTFAERASQGFSDGPFLHTDVFIKTGGDVPYTSADCPQYGSAHGDNCGDAGNASAPTGPGTGTGLVPGKNLRPGLGLMPPGGKPGSDTGLLGRIAGLLGSGKAAP